MAISNDILSSTLRILLDEEVDNLYKAVPLLDRMREQGGIETYDGGQKLDVPLILEEHSSITQLSNGYEPVNLAVKDALRVGSYDWCDFVAPIVITRKEELSNKGERAIINIAEARMKSVMGLLKREVEKQLVANESSVLTELNTFNGVTGGGALGSATGFFENAAFGAQTNVVGGIDKGTFTTYNNQFIDFGGNLATNMISNLTDLYVQCQINTPDGSAPDLIICSADFFRNYKNSLFAQEFYVDNKAEINGGRLALSFAGAMLYVDPFLPANGDGSGADDIHAYMLNSKFIKLGFDSDAQFEMEDFEHISGYASRSANVITRLQAYVQHLGSQGLITLG
jgi:hypothetical protein